MVDKKVSQKQQVKQTVKVIIGDITKKRLKRKRAVAKKAPAKAQVITFIQGSASGAYVPASNTPFTASTKLPVASGTEVRTRALDIKQDNPALNLSGSLSVSSQQRLEKNSMASNEGFPSKEQMIEKLKKMKQEEVEEARRAGTLKPLRESGNAIQLFSRDDTYYSSPLGSGEDSEGLPAYRPDMFLQMQKRREKRKQEQSPFPGLNYQQQEMERNKSIVKAQEKKEQIKNPIFAPLVSGIVKKPLTIEDFTDEEIIRPPKNFIPVRQRK